MAMDRFTADSLTTKLDRNLITLSEAKRYARALAGLESKAHTKEAFIREVWQANRAYADSLTR